MISEKHKGGKVAFSYVDRYSFNLSSNSSPLLSRICENLESDYSTESTIKRSIKIFEHPFAYNSIEKRKEFPYQHLTTDGNKYTYYRYNTLVRNIQISTDNALVTSYLRNDEAAGLIPIRQFIYNLIKSDAKKILVHASLIRYNGIGVLIVGNSRAGKTTLTTAYLEKGAEFIADENVILEFSNENLIGYYIPRVLRVRFSTLVNSPLSKFLSDIKSTNSTQYIDIESINRIIKAKAFHVDAGLAISRQAFVGAFGVCSSSSSVINKICFVEFGKHKSTKLSQTEGLYSLLKHVKNPKSSLSSEELQSPPYSPLINLPDNIEMHQMSFGFLNSSIKWI